MYGSKRRGILHKEDKGGGGDNIGDDMDNTDGMNNIGVCDLLPPGGFNNQQGREAATEGSEVGADERTMMQQWSR